MVILVELVSNVMVCGGLVVCDDVFDSICEDVVVVW